MQAQIGSRSSTDLASENRIVSESSSESIMALCRRLASTRARNDGARNGVVRKSLAPASIARTSASGSSRGGHHENRQELSGWGFTYGLAEGRGPYLRRLEVHKDHVYVAREDRHHRLRRRSRFNQPIIETFQALPDITLSGVPMNRPIECHRAPEPTRGHALLAPADAPGRWQATFQSDLLCWLPSKSTRSDFLST